MSSLIIIMAIFLYFHPERRPSQHIHVLCVCVLSPYIHTHSTDWFLMMIIGSAAVHVYIDYHSIVIHVSRVFFLLDTWSIIILSIPLDSTSPVTCVFFYIHTKVMCIFLRRRDESFHVSSHVCFFLLLLYEIKNKNGRKKKKNMFLRSSFCVCYPCRI